MFAMHRSVEAPLERLAMTWGVDGPTLCWLVCFSASVAWRHVLHAIIVFGGRWSTMTTDVVGTYTGYAAGIIFSTLLRFAVARTAILTGDVAFAAVLVSTALFNYVVLKRAADGRTSSSHRVASKTD